MVHIKYCCINKNREKLTIDVQKFSLYHVELFNNHVAFQAVLLNKKYCLILLLTFAVMLEIWHVSHVRRFMQTVPINKS